MAQSSLKKQVRTKSSLDNCLLLEVVSTKPVYAKDEPVLLNVVIRNNCSVSKEIFTNDIYSSLNITLSAADGSPIDKESNSDEKHQQYLWEQAGGDPPFEGTRSRRLDPQGSMTIKKPLSFFGLSISMPGKYVLQGSLTLDEVDSLSPFITSKVVLSSAATALSIGTPK